MVVVAVLDDDDAEDERKFTTVVFVGMESVFCRL